MWHLVDYCWLKSDSSSSMSSLSATDARVVFTSIPQFFNEALAKIDRDFLIFHGMSHLPHCNLWY